MTRRAPVTEKSRYRRVKDATPLGKGETYEQVLARLCPYVFGSPEGRELLAALFDHHALQPWSIDESESALRGQRAVVSLLVQIETHTIGRGRSDDRDGKRERSGSKSGE